MLVRAALATGRGRVCVLERSNKTGAIVLNVAALHVHESVVRSTQRCTCTNVFICASKTDRQTASAMPIASKARALQAKKEGKK